MKIRILLAALCILMISLVSAQDNELMVQRNSSQLYLTHSVAPKETWYSIGRLYNLSPKDIAPYNNLKMESPLAIGQAIKIPLNASNFSQGGPKAADEVFVPVYHVVQDKEWMFRISQNHNKVPVEKLQQWNNITNNDLKPGMKLVVGFLKVKSAQSALAKRPANPPVPKADVPSSKEVPNKTEPVAKNETVITKTEQQPNKPQPVATKTESVTTKTEPVATKTEPVATKTEPVANKTEPSANQGKPVQGNATADIKSSGPKSVNHNGGYFRSQFDGAGRASAGTAGIFKSTSGWNDGKYYALMNNVPVGTIIRVDHPVTRKSVYAKVLGQLPDMKESVGLAIRLSDAAAAELGAGAYKFNVDVAY